MRRELPWPWIAAALAVLVHARAVANGFAWDDVLVIRENAAIQSWPGLAASLVEPYWPGSYGSEVGVWRPVTTAWFGVQWQLFGGSAALMHLIGVLLHGVTTAAVVVLLAALLPPAAAAAGGLLFAVHPVHVEAVASLVGNADMLASLFVVLALVLHLRGSGPDPWRSYGWGRTLAVGGLYALGVLAKEQAIVLPALVLLLDAVRRDVGLRDLTGYLRARWQVYGTLAVVAAAILGARVAVLGAVAPGQEPAGAPLLADVPRLWTVAATWPHYVRLLLWPRELAADYVGIVPVLVRWTPGALLGVVAVLAALGLALWAWRTGEPLDGRRLDRKVLGLAVVWFGVTISPVSNVFFLSPVLVAERNLYLPSVAVALAGGWLLAHFLRERREVALALIAVLVILGGARSWERTGVWRDTWTVFDALLEEHPEAGRGWYFLGERLFSEGDPAGARRAYAVALGRLGSSYAISTTVASRLMAMGPRYDRAAEHLLRRAWEEDPLPYTAPGLLAAFHLNGERFAEGEPFARAALEREPDNAEMWRILAALVSGQGRSAEAVSYRVEALDRAADPPWRWWLWLARDYAAAGDTARALASLDSAGGRAGAGGAGEIESLRRALRAGAEPAGGPR